MTPGTLAERLGPTTLQQMQTPAAATILADCAHCPPPARPWLGRQSWTDMLLLHWALPAALLRPHLPAHLEVDTHGGQAWLSVVAYRMGDVRLRGMPAFLGRHFPQLNLRTYVRYGNRAAIYFLSLDAGDRLAVAAGRRVTGLPYHHAAASLQREGDTYAFASRRTGSGVGLEATYTAGAPRSRLTPRDTFLTERYAFYAAGEQNHLYCGEVRHRPWALADVRATVKHNDLAHDFPRLQRVIDGPPDYSQFAPGVDVLFWRPRRTPAPSAG